MPDRLDHVGIAADQPRRQMVGQQAHDRRATGADRVAVAGSCRAIGIGDGDDRGFLADEALDRIGALDLRNQVNHAQFNFFDTRHGSTPSGFSRILRRRDATGSGQS